MWNACLRTSSGIVVSAIRRSSGVAPRASVRVHTPCAGAAEFSKCTFICKPSVKGLTRGYIRSLIDASKDNLLYRRVGLPGDSDSQSPAALRLYIPASLRQSYLISFHEHLCHLGSTRMAQVPRARYYWPGQSKDIYTHVKECHECTLAKPPFRRPAAAAPKGPPVGSYPFDRVFVDVVLMAPTHDYVKGERGYSKLLVFVDSLSRWIEATPFNTGPTSEQVLHTYLSDVVCRHGTPRELRSDSGSNFVSDLTSTILKLTGTDSTPTEAHHHEGVGLVERAQQTLVALARATNEGGSHWADHLPFFLMSMRASPNRLTSQSPASLLYGRELRLPSQIGTLAL